MGENRKKKANQERSGEGKRRVRIGFETRKTTFGGTSIIRETTIDEKSQTKPKDESKSKNDCRIVQKNHKQFR